MNNEKRNGKKTKKFSLLHFIFPQLKVKQQILRDYSSAGKISSLSEDFYRVKQNRSFSCGDVKLVEQERRRSANKKEDEKNEKLPSCFVCHNFILDRETSFRCYNNFMYCERCQGEQSEMGLNKDFWNLAYEL